MLCIKKCGFYSNPEKNGYCSSCYDNLQNNNTIIKVSKTKRCEKCKRKVGINGFLCKCNKIFCLHHRLSFEHNCTFNHIQYEKNKIEKENPKIEKEKFEKI
jgi:hypothetical protein